MALVPLRVFGLLLLTLAIGVSSCQAVFPRDGGEAQPFRPGFVAD